MDHDTTSLPHRPRGVAALRDLVLLLTFALVASVLAAPPAAAATSLVLTDVVLASCDQTSYIVNFTATYELQGDDTIFYETTKPDGVYEDLTSGLNSQSSPRPWSVGYNFAPQTYPYTTEFRYYVAAPDGSNERESTTVRLTCTGPNTGDAVKLAPPVVTIDGSPYQVTFGQTVQVMATAVDTDGGTVTLAWNLYGGTGFTDATGSPVTFDATSRALGTYPISVRGTDDEGDTTVATGTVTVVGLPPTVRMEPSRYSVVQGGSIQLFSSATDTDGGTVTLAWDLDDDGAFDDATGAAPIFDSRSRPIGEHRVAVRGTDDEGDTAVATGVVRVLAAAEAGAPPSSPTPPTPQVQGPPGDRVGSVQITIDNPGDQPYTPDGPVVLGVLSDAAAFVLPDGCTVEDSELRCTIGSVPPGGSFSIDLVLVPGRLTPAAVTVDGTSVTVQPRVDGSAAAFAAMVAEQRFRPADGQPDPGAAFAQEPGTRPLASHVVLSRDDVFADSLGGAVLTGTGPLLLTGSDGLDEGTAAQVDRLLGDGGTVYLLGGERALSPAIPEALAAAGHTPVRLAGATRVETAIAVAVEAASLAGTPARIALARSGAPSGSPSAAWVDAVAAGGWSADTGQPVLLTPTDLLHPAVEAHLDANPDAAVTLLGGTQALSASVADAVAGRGHQVDRVAGTNRYATAAAIASTLWTAPADGRVVTPGEGDDGWAYTLVAAGLAADTDQPILLTGLDRLPVETDEALCVDGQRRPHVLLTPSDRTSPTVLEALGRGC